MASNPGWLTDWPWKQLGSFKYVILAPWMVRSLYLFTVKEEKDLLNFLILPFLLWRMVHNQIWITISRHRTAKGNNRIVDKSIEFEQADRESNWDDQILLNGVFITILLHIGPVEFLYYWLHRALHHHYLYSRYHSHHHSSIVTEPITSVIHPFAEHISYFLLFAMPMLATGFTGTASVAGLFGYITYIDLMNNMGHCNFEVVPKWLFSIFPPLKYMMYTPSYHSLHHTQFRTNYSLFMPIYDYIYGTMDKSTDALYETSLKRKEESPDACASNTSNNTRFHLSSTAWIRLLGLQAPHFQMRNAFKKLKLQLWVIPKFNIQYFQWRREDINGLIQKAILEADRNGIKVLSLGLLNQGEEFNRNGELYVQRNPQLKIKVVDGSSLAVALVLNSIPKGTTQVLLRGKLTKIAYSIAFALCQRGIQVATLYQVECDKLKLTTKSETNVVLSRSYAGKIWLVGDGLTKEEQVKASKGTLFIPFSQFPPKKIRNDCFYHYTPAMLTPLSFQNLHSCENWLPRRVMSAWRVAGIIHALEGLNVHECGNTLFDIQKVWDATLKHGFQPLTLPS
ncbi:hypothetical protein F0562_014649 [Nyssa sinensis]|uniref:Fatty acid hydroxylase domain-containing protein n=1 Tax=Nyssa sinensis TaxID=561372 RepID=A0A5J4ZNC6_9ASTE|nr:hypothetical protein F0562_014649 [Nyssa sinensis]